MAVLRTKKTVDGSGKSTQNAKKKGLIVKDIND